MHFLFQIYQRYVQPANSNVTKFYVYRKPFQLFALASTVKMDSRQIDNLFFHESFPTEIFPSLCTCLHQQTQIPLILQDQSFEHYYLYQKHSKIIEQFSILFQQQIIQYFMRKKTLRKNSLFPSMSLNNQRINSEPLANEQFLTIPHTSSIERYQSQLSKVQNCPLINFRVSKKPSINFNDDINKSKVLRNLSKATQEIKDLKQELKNNNIFLKTRTDRKLQSFMTKLTDSIKNQHTQSRPSLHQPIYYPVPVPFPMHLPQLSQHNLTPTRHKSNRALYRNDSFYTSNNQNRSFVNKKYRLEKNMKRWKKAMNCVLFIIYLRRFNKLAQINRQALFDKNIDKIKASLAVIRKKIIQSLNRFKQILLFKKQIEFDILEDDNRQVIKQKISSIRKFVGIILEGLLDFVRQNRSQVAMIETFYYLCKHGNYSCTQPLLTQQQMELTCISPAFGYVSAEKYLQKAALINLIVFKLLLFNILLSLHKMDPQFSEQTVSDNLYVISSVLYELAIDVQDDYMLKVPKTYKIGNYEEFSQIRFLESIVIGNKDKRPSDLISGLKPEEWTTRYFNFKGWQQQKQYLMTAIDGIQSSMAQLHRKLTKSCY